MSPNGSCSGRQPVFGSGAGRGPCTAKFKKEPFAQDHYSSVAPKSKYFATAKRLFKANAGQLPKDNTRPPQIVSLSPTALASSVVTTDFFGFDTSDNHYKLQGLGDVSEMGDAVLGLVASRMGTKAPRWIAVRNVSDPQIKADGMTLKQQAADRLTPPGVKPGRYQAPDELLAFLADL